MTALIGNTPMVHLARYGKKYGVGARLVGKVEGMNPSGSVKAHAALAMIEDAEQSGALQPGGTIIEPTSGNTGIGLAAIGAARGYRVILTMPDTMSVERRNLFFHTVFIAVQFLQFVVSHTNKVKCTVATFVKAVYRTVFHWQDFTFASQCQSIDNGIESFCCNKCHTVFTGVKCFAATKTTVTAYT